MAAIYRLGFGFHGVSEHLKRYMLRSSFNVYLGGGSSCFNKYPELVAVLLYPVELRLLPIYLQDRCHPITDK